MQDSIVTQINNRQSTLPLKLYDNVIVLGVGGIGGWAALNSALTGRVKKLFLVDPDTVESTNLNRTPFRFCDINNYKVDAIKYLILERRNLTIDCYKCKTDEAVKNMILTKCAMDTELNQRIYSLEDEDDLKYIKYNSVIIDCRDDIYEDFYDFPAKYYKVGYDGLSITIDGNPQNTPVWGHADNYSVTPSFVSPSQMAANIVINDIFVDKNIDEINWNEYTDPEVSDVLDPIGRLNTCITLDITKLTSDFVQLSNTQED